MCVRDPEIGQFQTLLKRGKNYLKLTAMAVVLSAGVCLPLQSQKVLAAGETRSISIYHIHTKESLTVTYMVSGRYVPSAMKKINHILRDWRRNEVITIDPRTVDLMYQLHEDLGSKAPVHIVSGYRSPRTNAFLKKIGRNVATKSQHMLGKAIDIYFPDVATKKIRNNALVMQVGGVGYYSSAGGPTGFLHIDSARVRHWGPAISQREMAQIFSDGRKIAARSSRGNNKGTAVAMAKAVPPPDAEAGYDAGGDDDMSALSAQVSKTQKKVAYQPTLQEPPPEASGAVVMPTAKPATILAQANLVAAQAKPELVEEPAQGAMAIAPKPRAKPLEVMMVAAANMRVVPASAPPDNVMEKPNRALTGQSLASLMIDSGPEADISAAPVSNESAKGSFADSLRDGTATDAELIKPMIATASAGGDINWWPNNAAIFDPEQSIRRNGAPVPFSKGEALTIPVPAPVQATNASPTAIKVKVAVTDPRSAPTATTAVASGKGNVIVEVDRSGKGSLDDTLPGFRATSN